MTSPAKFRKEKEIIAEYETQVKGRSTSIIIPKCEIHGVFSPFV